MTTSFDWIFHRDISLDSWQDELTFSFNRDHLIFEVLHTDLGVPVRIEEFTDPVSLNRVYFIKTHTGEVIFSGDEAELVIRHIEQTGRIPPKQLANYRLFKDGIIL